MTSYIPLGAASAEKVDLFFLPEFNLNTDSAIISGKLITKLSFHEILYFEKNQYMDDLDGVFLHFPEKAPYFCAFINDGHSVVADETDTSNCDEDQTSFVKTLGRATGLVGQAKMLEPLEHVSYHRFRGRVTIRPRIFGRNWFDSTSRKKTTEFETTLIDKLSGLLPLFDYCRNNASIQIAESIYSSINRASLSGDHWWAQRCLLYYSCLSLLLNDDISQLAGLESNVPLEKIELVLGSRNFIAHGSEIMLNQELEAALWLCANVLLCEAIARVIEEPAQVTFSPEMLIDGITRSSYSGAERIVHCGSSLDKDQHYKSHPAVPMQKIAAWRAETQGPMSTALERIAKFSLMGTK